MKTYDLIEHEFIRDEICAITITYPVSAEDQENLVSSLCGLLSELYVGPAKFVIFQGNLNPVEADGSIRKTHSQEEVVIAYRKVELLQDILAGAPFFSVSRMAGHIEDLFADIAIACDWRLLPAASQICFASHRRLNEVKTAARLAEIIGSFRAFDVILRRRIIATEEAVEIGLVLPENPEEDVVATLENYALAAKKGSIAIMRRAVRGPFSSDISVERIVSSIAAAG